ncbi:MAG: glutamine synthetase III [Chitinophagales bacterium]|nr:glutamine synthetase III [Chitinophagales bacterium]HMV15079.1 glutamine synthetase III [Chitinophagales bacterium]HMW12763.1 glutamine synthetase III [Chitinophagales bacterium]HMX60702.1 glutamine synthetase III [Chitinophagales bacterium]HMY23750.1 glutamine synthetase III [Chitinophagales bacterium]
MSKTRFNALSAFSSRPKVNVELPSEKISDFFASAVFGEKEMREFLPSDAYKKLAASIKDGKKVDREIADQVASAMKAWAMKQGATHFTHWFQPLTGTTAEKHDSFFMPKGGSGIEEFSSDALVQQEPDASSFPSGGIRVTFEARGYTAWDVTSPAFIMTVGSGKTLCVPTIFISYTGETLDYKAPLLKSIQALDQAATEVAHYFDRDVKHVYTTLGWEQEYFLVDSAMYYARPDLVMTGRTLLGRRSPKGQQLEDHYFGAIPERVYAYMRDFEIECLKLGIPVRTRHNEVAPSQYECAPMFEEANLAVDHNSLLMDVMDRVSSKHKLKVLFHEKPFAGINGSGKHNNWSMGTDTGVNLLSPGKTPRTNLQFLTFFINTIAAVNRHEELLRASVATHGNEHRLGANEAPPAIISVFTGSYLKEVLEMIESRVDEDKFDEQDNITLRLDIHNRIPDIMLDNTDRNRTSPFAFTGNKFEFRAVGSSANCALPMTVLNAIVAEQLKLFKVEVDEYIKGGDYKDVAILKVLRKTIKDAKRIMFEGDNYSDDWHKEAKKRGLSNNKTAPVALGAFVSDSSVKLFADLGIYSHREVEARYEIALENYIKAIQIESRALGEIVINQVIPACLEYQNKLITNIRGLKEIGIDAKSYSAQSSLLKQISEGIEKVIKLEKDMLDLRVKANDLSNALKQAQIYSDKVRPIMDEIRDVTDNLETIIDDELWPLPKYREMLFTK